jgi:cytochrome c1
VLLGAAAAAQKSPAASHGLAPAHATTQSPHGNLSLACESCHTAVSWRPLRALPDFNHNTTQYPLRGMHQGVTCHQCHTRMVFTNIAKKCSECHADMHRGQFGARCEQCHTVNGWNVSVKEIKQHLNRFPLVGAHASVECDSCHTGAAMGQFTGLSTDCYSCHARDFQSSAFDHRAAGLPPTCEVCHTVDTWFGAKFDHARFTGFALTGMHASLDCIACHTGGKYVKASADCYSCHAKDYTSTVDPNHLQSQFPHDCAMCHSTATWLGATFDHASVGFPLTGAHASLQCVACHAKGYTGTSTDCASCHINDYNGAMSPPHKSSNFPTTCAICHTTTAWQPATFDHATTGFPLTGAHSSLQCVACHTTGYTATSAQCISCHQNDYNGTNNPNHKAAGFPTDCSICHSTTSWDNAKFDHNTATKFPLTGAHTTLQCVACHANNVFAGTPTTCGSCHINDYNGTTNPNHKSAGFPTDCSICHSTTSWAGATFDHSTTGFPLTGAHSTLQCAACHTTGYTGTSAQCVSCHLNDYNGTTNPNHKTAGFPTDCAVCHTTTSWAGATFDHSKTGFPLTGAHVSVSCASCHVGGRYAGTPTDCYSCHKTDYTGTTNPNHVAAQFPTDCSLCHTTAGWSGATFNHTWFPIYSGSHAGKWTTCGDCHVNPANFAAFSCITCHQHDASTVVPEHSGVRNFVYNATSCYGCHPTGRGG